MRAKTKDNNSAVKRLIPAIAMLALSAVTLSTSTYAWFTMSKEVTMTGLNMAATASDGMEIALASVKDEGGTQNKLSFDFGSEKHPGDGADEKGWKSSVIVGEYYEDIGKLRPVSSVDGKTFFDAINANDRGKKATKFKSVELNTTNMATITKRSTLATSDLVIKSNGDIGYYVDIPVHLRTSSTSGNGGGSGAPIYYKIVINNNETEPDKTSNELYKAVRVAFITDQATTILGATDTYYGTGAVQSIGSDGVGTKTTVTMNSGETKSVFSSSSIDAYKNSKGTESGLEMPYATTAGEYSYLDFTVRVWLEGESTFCYDENAGQQWNIDLAFAMGEFSTTA